MASPNLDSALAAFEQTCRQRRIPVTPQRRAVLAHILQRQDHPTADQVYDAVARDMPNLSRTSVFRILDLLVNVGLVDKVCHPGSVARYDPRTARHHHLVCLQCEKIIDIEDPHLNQLAAPDVRRHGFRIDNYLIHFRGVCADCLRHQQHPPTSTRANSRPGPAAPKPRSSGSS